ncbi:methyltransferase [Candidatus Woesearchaeota archaeon]|nr:methyltransferase [Candidatus Woesearchaeota archaeon]
MQSIITIKEAKAILAGKGSITLSLDLGLTTTNITLSKVIKLGDQNIPLPEFKKVREDFCYLAEDNTLKKVAFFSDETQLYYKLFPTKDWPTFMISATPMHRYIHLSPKEDTLTKIEEIKPVVGKVLDTCCGMGYTAITSADKAAEVHTYEWDQNVLRLADLNPYSQKLFNSKNIILHEESIIEGIRKFKSNFFDRVIHDPPTFKRSPELYSLRFYHELYRIMKNGGILYHYVPNPGKTKGTNFYEGVVDKLLGMGFKEVEFHAKSSGVRAVK